MNKTEITAEPGVPLIVISRDFDAPRDLVYRAYTEPELLVQWVGPRELTTTVDSYEVMDGGRWRYVQRDPAGNDHGFHGIFHGTPSPECIVQTFEYESMPGHVLLQTTTFGERDGSTQVRVVASFQSVADRDGMVSSGMERGVRDGDERLDELLATLQAG
jgi:uncharacterized protein YndB with AHSA1/START domain